MPYTEFVNESGLPLRLRVVKTTASGNVHIYIAGPEEDDDRYYTLEQGPNIVDWEFTEF